MRLTLRTLLAYIDEILDPKEAGDFKERINQSEMATNLLYRIRDVMRRLRLKAPSVDDRGDGLDPNTVSEYLDNVLPDDRVPDFERVCLESDMQLAEVASCHQILAIVLGEGAEIEEATIQHMYQLPEVAAEQALMARQQTEVGMAPTDDSPTPPPVVDQGADTSETPPPSPKVEVPGYLRQPTRRPSHLVPGLILIFVVLCVATIGLALNGKLAFLGIGPSGDAEQVAVRADAAESQTQPASTVSSPSAVSESASAPATTAEPSEVPTVTTPPSKEPGQEAVVPVPAKKESVEKPATAPSETQPDMPIKPTTETGPPVETGPSAESQPEAQSPVAPIEPVTEPAGETVEQPGRVGTLYTGKREILLQWDANQNQWQRVVPRAEVRSETPVIAPPTFRPVIGLANSTTVELIDGAKILLEPGLEPGVPAVTFTRGRLVIQTAGKPDRKIVLSLPGRTGVMTLLDPDSTVAIELLPVWTRGANPEEVTSEVMANLYAIHGRIGWKDGPGTESSQVEINGKGAETPRLLILEGNKGFQAMAIPQLPTWIGAAELGKLDQNASSYLEGTLANRPVSLALREMLADRRSEFGRLAIRSLCEIGEVEPLVATLNNEKRTPIWSETVTALRTFVRQSPESAKKVREVLEKTYGEQGGELFRMLWGYSDEQLAAGQDSQLVKALGSPLLATRVLAYWTLRDIVPVGPYYKPDTTLPKRQQAAKRWEDQQKKGLIRHQKP